MYINNVHVLLVYRNAKLPLFRGIPTKTQHLVPTEFEQSGIIATSALKSSRRNSDSIVYGPVGKVR